MHEFRNETMSESATVLAVNSSMAVAGATSGSDERVIERALQGYVPETPQQVSELVSGLMSILPLDEVSSLSEP